MKGKEIKKRAEGGKWKKKISFFKNCTCICIFVNGQNKTKDSYQTVNNVYLGWGVNDIQLFQ